MALEREKRRLKIYLIIFASIMVFGSAGFMMAEHLDLANALYFSIVTVATVGYGDIAPSTVVGKVLAVLMIFAGTGTFLGVVATGTEIFLARREQETRHRKLQMIVGLFFTETGNSLLQFLVAADPLRAELNEQLRIGVDWQAKEFENRLAWATQHEFKIEVQQIPFVRLRDFLNDKGNTLVRLLENPYLLEEESLSLLLTAILHLKEELLHRSDFDHLPPNDMQHLAGDINRIYRLIVPHWLTYLQHLQECYPFLYSLARRTNPFDDQASVVVQ